MLEVYWFRHRLLLKKISLKIQEINYKALKQVHGNKKDILQLSHDAKELTK